MEIRALLFDVNGTLIDIETDEWMDEAYRAIAHFLTYQGIALHRTEVRELYFQIMKEQFAASTETYPEFDVVAVWRELLRRCATDYTRSLGSEKLRQMPLFLAELQRGITRKRLVAFPRTQEILADMNAVKEVSEHKIWIEKLLRDYYDPLYFGSLERRKPKVLFRGTSAEAHDYLQSLYS